MPEGTEAPLGASERGSPLAAADPRAIGEYELLRRLGQGAMGMVYLGRDRHGKYVALKLVRPEFAEDPLFLRRFREEARHASRVDATYTARLIAAVTDVEHPYLVTEYIDGLTLDEQVTQNGPLSPADAKAVAISTATALIAIHDAEIVHRDLKPSNVMLSRFGARVIDFGIARSLAATTRITQAGGLIGTPAYMSPEQIQDEELTPTSDVFSWAGVMVYATTGHQPFGTPEANLIAIYHKILEGQPNLADVPDDLRDLIATALAKDPAARPTARHLLELLTGSPSVGDASEVADRAVGETMTAQDTAPGSARDHPDAVYRPRRPTRAVGIDLGTTNSMIAILDGGKPTVIVDNEGRRMTPSAVAFARNGEVLVGEVATRQAVTNVDRTICSVKRHMGIAWTVDIDGKMFTPQQISAFVLQKLKRDAEAYRGEKITDAVITVPASFNDGQRQATREAGQIAGLNVLRVISEPAAAALAYHQENEDEATILVFDLGGGALSVAIMEVGERIVAVKATSGDNQLGGDDWDQRIVDWLVKNFKKSRRNGRIDLSKDKIALQRLREAAEKAKIELSQSMESQIKLPSITHSFSGPLHLDAKLTRAEFQRMTSDLLDRCKTPVEQVIKDAGIKVDDIDHVLLVGGSTQMPAVADLVKSLTGGKEPVRDFGGAVAKGAAVQAGVLSLA